MDETKELENYLKDVKDPELAETIDFAFNQEFQEIDPSFQSYYKKEIDRLRAYDALKVQLSILKKEENKIKKYLKDEQKYQIIMNNLDKLEQMYNEWKNSLTEEDLSVLFIDDWQEEFLNMSWFDLEKVFPEIRLTTNLIKKMLRTARDQKGISKVKEKYKITKPEKPEQNNDLKDLKENQIDRSYSKKSDAELLEMLSRSDLEYLADMIGDAVINGATDKLKIAIRFTFAHYCQSNTKGKEYSRTDKQTIKDTSKTSGKNIVDLLKKYNSMLSE